MFFSEKLYLILLQNTMIFADSVSLSGFKNAWYNKATILPLIQENVLCQLYIFI